MSTQRERRDVLLFGKHKRQRDHRVTGAGYSLPAAAKELGVSYGTMRIAVEQKQVRVINFAGQAFVPLSEIKRLKELFEQQQ